MNKYNKQVYKNEVLPCAKSYIKNKIYVLKLLNYYIKNRNIDKIYEPGAFYIKWKILTLSEEDRDYQEWFIDNIINNLNKNEIIHMFMQNLNDENIFNNEDFRKTMMDSFKLMRIIKDITIKDNIYKLILKNNDTIYFTNLLQKKEDIKKYTGRCHEISYDYFKKNEYNKNEHSVTILEKDLFKNTRYHTFIVKNNYVYDYARNLFMKYDDYMKLLEVKIISYDLGKAMIDEINYLEQNNIEFKKSKLVKVLKHAVNKSINSFK